MEFGDDQSISIHMPLTGHDMISTPYSRISCSRFQSTCPLRGTTINSFQIVLDCRDFNPHAPYGARPDLTAGTSALATFQSTCPLRGTT